MRHQEIFDKVATHLLTQNEKSVSTKNGFCRYRTKKDDGKVLMCAVGCLISDEFYSEDLENENVYSSIVQEALRASGLQVESVENGRRNLDLLGALQRRHDSFRSNTYAEDGWAQTLKAVAKIYDLSEDVIDNFETKDAISSKT